MSYVDGFVLPVPKKNLAAYRKQAKRAAAVWMDHGALAYVECIGDDVPKGKTTSFTRAVKLKPSEVPWFSWIVFASKAERNRINKLVMADPRLADMMDPKNMAFDGKRMIYGGFKAVIEM